MSTLPEAHATAALISQGSTASYLFTISGAACELSVVSFNVEEQISSPFELDITVATQDEVVLEDLLDKGGLLTVICGTSKRYFHGVVRECTCLGDNGDYSIFQIFLVPSVWLLSLEQDCRIFQDMNTQDIICKILEESGITGDLVRLALVETERKRKYCVQYRETDLNFITRLLEDEGIFYFFEHYKDKHVIVFADNPSAYLKIQGESHIRFNISGGNVPKKESVTDFIYSRRLHPGKVTQRDFNYKRINLDLTINKETKKPSAREIYDYPGNYFKQQKGDITTQIHQERIQVTGETAEGQSNCPRLIPGCVWQLTNNDFEGEYLTVGVSHTGSQPQVLGEQAGTEGFHYANSFVVIPAEVVIRPQIAAERPIISGIQTATVVGRKGEEIHTDDLGRVMVQFHWDRLGKKDDKSSCWIRVAQSWGGLSRGAQYIPRIGDEVLVEFAEGDPDRPIITGSVYNGDKQPINSLKKSITQSGFRTKTHKGEGFHELRFDDAKGKEEIYLQSEKDWNILVKSRKGQTVGGDNSTVIGKNSEASVGGNSFSIVTGKQTELAKEIVIAAYDKLTIVSGASSIVISPAGVEINSPIVKVNCGGGAPMPPKQPVSGCTGKGGSSGGGGKAAEGGASSTSPSTGKPSAAAPSTTPDQIPETKAITDSAAPPDTEKPLDTFKGTVPSGGWTELDSPVSVPEYDGWTLGPVSQGASGLGDLVSSGSTSPLLKGAVLPGAGDLVSSATSSLPGDLKNRVSQVASVVQNPASLKDTAVNEGRNRLNQELNNAKGKLLEKTGIGDAQNEANQELNKLRDLLKRPGIKKEDLIKKF